MAQKDKSDFANWIGLRTRLNFTALPAWMGGLVGVALTLMTLSLVLLVGATLIQLLYAVLSQGLNANPASEDIRNLGLAAGAMIGIPFLIWRSVVAQKQVNVTEQGHITDRINKAVEGLGSFRSANAKDKESDPNIEVRIGSLFALERISQDSARDHIQIMEILCAYIRNNADRHSPRPPEEEPIEGWRGWASEHRKHPPLDVDTALKIIERRSDDRKTIEKAYNDGEGYRLGLERARLHALNLYFRDLTGADLADAQLQGANLFGAKLQGANLWGAELKGAYLRHAQLQGADLNNAQLQGADLSKAKLHGANLAVAKLHGADLAEAQLQGADLAETQLQGAILEDAQLQGADLRFAKFDRSTRTQAANFSGSACVRVDFTDSTITLEQLESMFGDASTKLPDGLTRPTHWPKEELSWTEFDTAWRSWQAEIGFQPPKNP